jgi:putative redox protein
MTAPIPPTPDTNVRVRWSGEKKYAVTRDGAPAITIDGDRTAGPGPVETLLGALAACSAMDVVEYLIKRRTPASALEIVVGGVRNATAPRRVLSASLDFHIDGDGIDADHAERSVALAVGSYCSVASSLAEDVEIVTRVVLNGAERAYVLQPVTHGPRA